MKLHVEAQIMSPVAMTVRRATGNDVDTLEWIPGTAVRGAMAAWYGRQTGRELGDAAFQRLFVSGGVRFGCLRPAGADFWPLSARLCKDNRDEHAVMDRLLRVAAGVDCAETCHDLSNGNQCGAKLEVALGFTRKVRRRTGGQAFQTEAVRTRRITHSAIDRKLLKTRSGQLFSVRSIEQGQKFHGYITVADGLMDEIKQLWPEDKDLSLRLGRARSRGQGEVQLRWSEARADEVNIQVRVEEMQNKAAQLRERLTGKVVVSVTLQAPAIVRDDYLLFKTWLGPADVGLKEGWELLSWFSRPTLIGGWHEAAQVPRSEASGIAAGSCFLFGCEQDRTMIAQMAAWGEQLEASGIGERRIEGFGEVRCCHEIHAECAERL